jgi:hypothetical protein
MAIYNGYLFSRLGAVGTMSEGPIYYIQHFESNREYQVRKHSNLWENDADLHPFLNRKVTIEGELSTAGWIDYRTISGYVVPPGKKQNLNMESAGIVTNLLRNYGMKQARPDEIKWNAILTAETTDYLLGRLQRLARAVNLTVTINQDEFSRHISANPTEPFNKFVEFIAGHLR